MAEMVANTAIDLDAILAQVSHDCLRRIERWLNTQEAASLSNEMIDASIHFLLSEDDYSG
jgi:hypothetical protein